MKVNTVKAVNPYLHSDTNKRYMTYEYYTRALFGCRVARIPLDAHFTCPNIDGKVGIGGCIYCKNGSAAVIESDPSARNFVHPSDISPQTEADYTNTAVLQTETDCINTAFPQTEADYTKLFAPQFERGVAAARRKWKCGGFLPYLQAHTNTYGSPGRVSAAINAALRIRQPDSDLNIFGVIIATRADCLDDGILEVIAAIDEKYYVSVELGLQTSRDETAVLINRGHTWSQFRDGFARLRNKCPHVKLCVHCINGLPGESRADMQRTASDVASLCPDLVKIHLLHVIDGTPMADLYRNGLYTPMDMRDYVETVCCQLELLPPDCCVARLTGDGMPDELVAPMWSRRKIAVLNEIDKELARRDTFQGRLYNA